MKNCDEQVAETSERMKKWGGSTETKSKEVLAWLLIGFLFCLGFLFVCFFPLVFVFVLASRLLENHSISQSNNCAFVIFFQKKNKKCNCNVTKMSHAHFARDFKIYQDYLFNFHTNQATMYFQINVTKKSFIISML